MSWLAIKRWYLGGEFADQEPRTLKRVGFGPIPLPGEIRSEREAMERARRWGAHRADGHTNGQSEGGPDPTGTPC